MDDAIVDQIVSEVFEALEPLEAQSAAILQFLKAKGLATEEDLAPFLEQAGNTANVRWRAVRVRVSALIANAFKAGEAETAEAKAEPGKTKAQGSTREDGEQKPGADEGREQDTKTTSASQGEQPAREAGDTSASREKVDAGNTKSSQQTSASKSDPSGQGAQPSSNPGSGETKGDTKVEPPDAPEKSKAA